MISVLSDQNFGSNTTQVEAALKKHEAIAADVEARVGICKYTQITLSVFSILHVILMEALASYLMFTNLHHDQCT